MIGLYFLFRINLTFFFSLWSVSPCDIILTSAMKRFYLLSFEWLMAWSSKWNIFFEFLGELDHSSPKLIYIYFKKSGSPYMRIWDLFLFPWTIIRFHLYFFHLFLRIFSLFFTSILRSLTLSSLSKFLFNSLILSRRNLSSSPYRNFIFLQGNVSKAMFTVGLMVWLLFLGIIDYCCLTGLI